MEKLEKGGERRSSGYLYEPHAAREFASQSRYVLRTYRVSGLGLGALEFCYYPVCPVLLRLMNGLKWNHLIQR